MNQPLAITGPDGNVYAAARVLPDGTLAAQSAVDGQADCCCDTEPPVFGDWCFVQIFRCSCWDASQSRWFPAHRLYVDGQIKPVYVIDGQCWYTGRAVVLTPNFSTPGYPFYIGDIGPGTVGPWFETCAEGGCTTNQCPCVGQNRLWTSRRNVCGPPNIQVCARYVTLEFAWLSSISRTIVGGGGCPSTNIVSTSSAVGRIVFDIWANAVVSASIVNSATANGNAPDGIPGNPCRTRNVSYTFDRTISAADTFGPVNIPAWSFFNAVMNGSMASRNNSFGAASPQVPVLDPDRDPDHFQAQYQPPPGAACLLTYNFADQFGSLSHVAGRNPFSETVNWQQTGTGGGTEFTASGSRAYGLSFSATVPDIQPGNCPGAVLGQPCTSGAPIGIDVLGSLLNAADFNRVAVVDGKCYTPEPDITAGGVIVDQWVPNCADPACGDGPPPPGGEDDDTGDPGVTLEPGGPRSRGLVSEAELEAQGLTLGIAQNDASDCGCCQPPSQR